MSIFKSILDIASTPIRCVGELGKDLSSLTDDKKDGLDGILSIGTLGMSSIAKGIVKSLEKAGEDLDDE
jgi:hypothetical protein